MNFIAGDYILYASEIYRVLNNYGYYGDAVHLETNTTYTIQWETDEYVATKQIIVQYLGDTSYGARHFYVLSGWNDHILGYQCVYEPDGTYVMEARGTDFTSNFEILNERFYIVEINSGEVYNMNNPYMSYLKAISELSFLISQSYYTNPCMISA